MIDINSLNELPKVFSKELLEFKHFFSVYNEIKAEITYIKSTIEIEAKSFEGLSKANLIHTKNFHTEILFTEDVTNLLQIQKVFIAMFETISNEQMMSGLSNIVNKKFSEISDDIGDHTKGLVENINHMVKELSNARTKYKAIYSKLEKNYKELELNLVNKKKMENDEKNAYNQSMKEKANDKILNILNEFVENKFNLTSSFEECKRLEIALNELMKKSFVNSIKFIYSSINHFRNSLEEISENREQIINKQKEAIVSTTEQIKQTDFTFANQEVNYNNLKSIKTEFEYLLGIFSIKQETDIMNTNTVANDSLNLEEHFNRANYQSSPITDHILAFIFAFLQIIYLRKKHYTAFNKVIIEVIRNYENFISLSNKLIKNLTQPKVNIISNCPFLLQICDFVRSLSELVIRKYEEFTKFAVINFVNPIEHSVLKDLNSDEVILNQIFSKIQKEYNNYKANINRLTASKEKVVQNIEKIKENILKTSEDANNFSKFEKQFLALRTEEGNLNESCLEYYKKYKKFLEECVEIARKTIMSSREKEVQKSQEFKENLVQCLKLQEKNLNQILEFLDFRSQIISDDSKASDSIKLICQNFANEFDLKSELNELNITNIVKEIINNPKELKDTDIQTTLNNALFLNKEEIIQNKEFNLSDLISNDELKQYYDKLDFLRYNSSKKISVKNSNSSRKMYDDVFYIDPDENIVSYFSCALNDKILLQGKLYITNKKVVFYSWFNNSTLFGKTLIEIPKEDIVEIERQKNMIFDNMILVKTKTAQFLFASFIYRESCYYVMREALFGEPNPQNLPASGDKRQSISPIVMKKNDQDLDLNHYNINDLNENGNRRDVRNSKSNSIESLEDIIDKPKSASCSPKVNKKEELLLKENTERKISDQRMPSRTVLTLDNYNAVDNTNNNSIKIDFEEVHQELQIKPELNKLIIKKDLPRAINNFNNKRIESFIKQNLINFQANFINNYKLGDIPLSLIYHSIFDPDIMRVELGKNKNFWASFMESRQDYDMKLTKLSVDNLRDILPEYIANKNNYIFTSFADDQQINKFIEKEIESACPLEIPTQEFKYNYTHPILKKKFMGPSKLEVEDHFKIYFVSPMCLIIRIYSYLSGFMMMDTFYTVLQYKFDSIYKHDNGQKRMRYDTSCSISFHVEFVKETWFREKIKNEGQTDVEECVRTATLPCISKVLNSEQIEYNAKYDEFLRKKADEEKDRAGQIESVQNYVPPENIVQPEVIENLVEIFPEKPVDNVIQLELPPKNLHEAKTELFKAVPKESIEYLDVKKFLQEYMILVLAVFVIIVLLLLKLESSLLFVVILLALYLIYKLEKIEKKLELIEMRTNRS